MNNIFENAKFGDKFLTRDGKVAIFIRYNKDDDSYDLETSETICYAREDGTDLFTIGKSSLDIVSRYQEPIDEDKLDELADNYAIESTVEINFPNIPIKQFLYEGFKEGYRKAIEG